jgi:hypothetical protein
VNEDQASGSSYDEQSRRRFEQGVEKRNPKAENRSAKVRVPERTKNQQQENNKRFPEQY